jgi:hypothetical protein
MPVLPIISQGIKTGLKFTPSAPPQVVGAITSISQAVMASMALMPMFPTPIPVIPFGQAISSTMVKIEAMIFKTFEAKAQIVQKLIEIYNKDLTAKTAQRKTAVETLYNNEKTAQDAIKEEITVLQTDIATLTTEVATLTTAQDAERVAYMKMIYSYKDNAKKADVAGKTSERDAWIAKVGELDGWLAQIILMTIEIIGKRLEKTSKEKELIEKQVLANLSLKKEWTFLEEYATDFGVAVPNYPDLPTPPSLPPTIPIPQENFLTKALRQIFAKWIATPTVPPIGLTVAAIQLLIQSFQPSTPPPLSAQVEAQADAFILMLGGAF